MRRIAILILAGGLAAAMPAVAARRVHRPIVPAPIAPAPVPPARPAELRPAPPAPAEAKPAPSPAAPAEPPPSAAPAPVAGQSCTGRLAAAGIIAEPAAPTQGPSCTIEEPIRLISLTAHGQTIVLPEKPILACRTAEPLAQWLGDIVGPVAAAGLGSPLAKVWTGPGYECRPRNHVSGAKLSAHGVGLAIDIAGFELADGRRLAVEPAADKAKDDPAWRQVFASLRIAACGWFLTVLGPGSDAAHATHLHLDIQQHGSSDRYRICQ